MNAVAPLRRVPRTPLALLIYALLALALSWPLPLHLGTRVIGNLDHPGCRGDLFYQYDMQQQMERGEYPRHRRLVSLNHPRGMELPVKDMFALHLFMYVALMTVLGLLASHNLAVLGMVVLNAASMHLLIRERSGREDFAYLSGLIFGFGSFVFLKVQQGFPQKACLFLLPLFVLFLLRALQRHRVRDHVAVLACLLAMLWIYPPYAVYDVVFAVPLVFYRALRGRTFWDDIWRFAPSLLVVVVAFAAVTYSQRGDPTEVEVGLASFRSEGGFMPLLDPFHFYPYSETFVVPPADFIPWMPLGFPIALTAMGVLAVCIGARDARFLALLGGAFALVMAGPYVSFGGETGDPWSTTFKLPFYYLATLPGGGALRYPIRLYPWVLTALLLVVGSGLAPIRAGLSATFGGRAAVLTRWIVIALLVLTVLEFRVLFPEYRRFWSSELPSYSFFDEIADEEFEALMMLPPKPLVRNGYLLDPIVLDRPLVNGYWGGESHVRVPEARDPEVDKHTFMTQLRDYGVPYIIVRLDNLDPNYLRGRSWMEPGQEADRGPAPYYWLDALCGKPRIYADDAMAVYSLPGSP